MDFYPQENAFAVKGGNPKSFLTEADLASEKFIIEKLKEYFPGIQIVSEENAENVSAIEEKAFFVDPLDGTRNFVDKLGHFSVNIGYCESGRPKFGVVFLPQTEKVYFAQKGQGAFLLSKGMKKKISVAQRAEKILIEKEIHHGMNLDFFANIEKKLPEKKFFDCATGVKICEIACGNADVFVNTSGGTSKWDVCAAEIVLSEAGGVLTDFEGVPINYSKENSLKIPNFWARSSEFDLR